MYVWLDRQAAVLDPQDSVQQLCLRGCQVLILHLCLQLMTT